MNYISLSSKSSWGLCFFIMLFIFSPILSEQETAQPGELYVLAIVVPTIFMAINKSLIRLKLIDFYAILLFLFAIWSTAISDYGSTRVGAFMKYLVLIIFFICTNSIVLTSKQLNFSFISYFGLSIVLSILIILSFVFGYPHTASDYYQGRYSIGITGLYKNPNYLVSFYNIAFFVICYILAIVKINKKKMLILYASLVLFLFSSYLTGTRAALMVEFLIILSIPIMLAKRHQLYKSIPVVLILIFIISKYFTEIKSVLFYFLGDRDVFQDEGRESAWMQAFKYIQMNPLLGCGHNSWYVIHGSSYLDWLHNVFLELILDQGIIGFLLLIGIIATGYKNINANDKSFLVLFFIFSSIPMLFQNGLYEVHFWRYIIINRLLLNFSASYKGGITAFLNETFGTSSDYRLVSVNH